ncbi:beta-ketoacyl synthase N-terminal-like domain-containing protein [Streptomyces boninensis]|uniref:beta-ketoacyl synthase N-terminal-like domain-containing protein n=1 Tax=Streptomyces boninensis TaxID=2039455 RepID=UPI003B215102
MTAATDPASLVRTAVRARLAEWYGLTDADIADDRPFAELGLTSRDAVVLAAEIGELLGATLPSTLLWDAPTLRALAELAASEGDVAAAGPGQRPAAAAATAAAASAATATSDTPSADVAVVGIGCRLPGATGPDAYWRLLSERGDAVGTVPEGRWEPFTAGATAAELDGISRHGGFLGDLEAIAGFDAEFFGIAPQEAALMDPQQRLLLEVAREALDHAAVPAARLAGSRTGVFVGISGNEYAQVTTAELGRIDAWTPPGAALSIAANRLSYALDLRGPSLALDTACSSSLVAVHHAVRSLATGESDAALAGGVNLLLSPAITLGFQRAGALAPDGRCKAFDASADGMVRGEGCAVIVLKRLADAERDGDRVLSVIRATAVNSDGRSNGLLAPNAAAQRALLHEAYATGVGAGEVDYVEAHGTGTALGDPIEAGALGRVLGPGRDADRPLLLGCAKSNLGHLEAAAGIAGLIKTVLALHHDEIPPHLHFTRPSPHIDFDALSLRVVTDSEPWPRYSGVATAGVSAFGFGGTNAHVVLSEYRGGAARVPAQRGPAAARGARAVSRTPAIALLDAPTPARLRADAADLGRRLAEPGPLRRTRPHDVARTLSGRTGRGRHGAAVVTRDPAELAEAFTHLAESRPHPAVLTATAGRVPQGSGPVWVFSGYGSQWPGMARSLLQDEPAFAAELDRLEPLLRRHAGLSLRDHLDPEADLTAPSVVQPVLYGIQVALAALWRSYGVEPAAVIGHSMGEIAAAVAAGVLSPESGALIVGARSRLLDGLEGGAMAVVGRSEPQVRALLSEESSVHVAVHASPEQCVVTGAADEIEALISHITEEGGLARALPTKGAGHSPQIDPLLAPLTAELGDIPHTTPICGFYTTVREDPRAVGPFDAAYWAANLRRPVRFAQAVTAAAEDGHRRFVEISPHPTQLHPLAETLTAAGAGEDSLVLPTLRRGGDDAFAFRSSLATLILSGTRIDPRTLHPEGRITDLPLPRWHRRRYWATDDPPQPPTPVPANGHGTPTPVTTLDRLRTRVAAVMGYQADSIDPATPLTDLGLDSLMAARIGAAVLDEFGAKVDPKVLLRQGTLADVAAVLADPDGDAAEAGAAGAARPAAAKDTDAANGPAQPAGTPPPARVLPRDAAERLVAHAWHHVAGGEAPGAEEDLRLAEHPPALLRRFAAELSERAGLPVTSDDLTPDSPTPPEPITIAAIAARLRPALEAADAEPIRQLRAGGTRPPLFLAHPAGGSSSVYRPLVARIGADRPCYGLERLPDLRDVPERAAAYADLIRTTHPEGPWVIGGWSYGGLLAQETARTLSEHGTVAALVLIDSVLPLPAEDFTPADGPMHRFAAFADYVERAYGSPLTLPYAELAALSDDEQVELVMKTLEQAVDLPGPILEHQRTSYLDLRSGERHSPRPYDGRTLLYRATEVAPHTVQDPRYERTDAALGWDAYCRDLTVHDLPTHHLALLDPPAVDVLAAHLARDLDGS